MKKAKRPIFARGALRFEERLVFILLATVSLVFLVVLAFEANLVIKRVDGLRSASTDNIPWNLSQVEVEFLHLKDAAHRAHESDMMDGTPMGHAGNPDVLPALADVRTRFDILYSRMTTIRDSALYSTARSDATFAEATTRIWDFLHSTTPTIDGPDLALLASLTELERGMSDLQDAVRHVAVSGITRFSIDAENERRSVLRTLTAVGITNVLAILLLGLLSATLWVSWRKTRRAHAKQEVLTDRMAAVISTSPTAIVVTDSNMNVVDANDTAFDMFGYSREAFLAERMTELVVSPEYKNALSKGLPGTLEEFSESSATPGRAQVRLRRKSGETFPADVTFSSPHHLKGDFFVAFIRDMTKQVADERALTDARDRALAGQRAREQMLTTMSHEMRTPLHGMLSSMEVIEDTLAAHGQSNHLEIMKNSARLLLQQIDDVLNAARSASEDIKLRPERIDLRRLIERIVAENTVLAQEGGNTLTIEEYPDDVDNVIGDELRLRQILLNLIGNANKFTAGGRVAVHVKHGAEPDVLEFRVADTGIGIAPADQAHIFDDFYIADGSYSRRFGGSGLGLGIARRLVEALGGEIGVVSDIGSGSTFWFRVPLPAADAPPAREIAKTDARRRDEGAPDEPTNAPRDVLVVEDNHINRMLVREALERNGYRVTEAVDGMEGVKKASEHAFSAILMDISMPGMDGLDATRLIRTQDGPNALAPIIALTAHAFPEDRKRILNAGCDRVLTKPFSLKDLANELEQIIEDCDRDEADATAHVFDPAPIEEIIAVLGIDSAQVAVEAFAKDARAALARFLRRGPNELSGKELESEAHRMKGSAAIIGATRLRSLMAEIEQCARSATDTDALISDNLPTAIEDTISALAMHVARQNGGMSVRQESLSGRAYSIGKVG